jgi:rhodanese-related sulfurtransferase
MNFSQITDDLFIGGMPAPEEYAELHRRGVILTINMRFIQKLPAGMSSPPPYEVLWLRTWDNPLLPIPLRALEQGTRRALQALEAGGKVHVHCAYGRHRSVAMGAAILLAQGYTPQAAMQQIKTHRPAADPDVFYIRSRIFAFSRYWQANAHR